uniref:DUF4220 domain-containing protein n=1 Tax=Oryza barthii TaxID=65489 RepID=A0A0D3HB40_9ORYZ
MGLSSAVEWWQESQLRILVIASTIIQLLLFLTANRRKHITSPRFRFIVWLAYLGSDATAIYALATLFNRHKNQDSTAQGSSSILEVVWAPVLLIHLGGQDSITAYNIEDNELWRRNVVTMTSQVTVSIYVFCKSWPGGDKKLLQAAIVLFVSGVLKCIEKPWALRSASINNLVSSDMHVPRTGKGDKEGDSISLQSYVEQAKKLVLGIERGEGNTAESLMEEAMDFFLSESDDLFPHTNAKISEPYKVFVDLPQPYSTRLVALKSWWKLEPFFLHTELGKSLADTFYRLYTKSKMLNKQHYGRLGWYLRLGSAYLPFASIGLFHNSHREAYNSSDVKVTYMLLCCTAVIEYFSAHGWTTLIDCCIPWSDNVSQCRLIGSYAGITIKPRDSSEEITGLVVQHVKSGWIRYITDGATYREFNDLRGQLALRRNNCDQALGWSLRVPFDESVLLWHLATEFCCARTGHTYEGGIIEISNYMIYLLLHNPEMLMAGTRRNIFTTAIQEIKDILGEEKPLEYQGLAENIIAKLESEGASRCPSFISDAWAIAEVLLDLGNKKMKHVIKGVWVEMLCFSASRCRGYLHAKSLGAGGELLTFVWLVLLYMGMEPLAERLQRADLPEEGGGNDGATTAAPLPPDDTLDEAEVPNGEGNNIDFVAQLPSDEILAEKPLKTEVPNREGNNTNAAAHLSSDEILAERTLNTEVPNGEGNIGDVPSTSQDSIAIDIEEDNAS